MISKDTLRILRYILLTALIGFCVVIAAHLKLEDFFFLFIGPRHIYFRIALEVLAALWLMLMVFDPTVRPKRNYILYALLALLAITGITSLVGPNPDKSIFSNFERMEGWIGFFHWSLFAIMLGSLVHRLKEWAYVFLVSSVGFWYLVTVGYIQKAFNSTTKFSQSVQDVVTFIAKFFGLYKEHVVGVADKEVRDQLWSDAIRSYFSLSKSTTRIESFAGNSSYFATLLFGALFALLFFLAYWYVTKRTKSEHEQTARLPKLRWYWLSALGLAVLYFILTFVTSTAALVPWFITLAILWFVAILIPTIHWLIKHRKQLVQKNVWWVYTLGFLYILYILGMFFYSETRGAIVGLAVAALAAGLKTVFHKGAHPHLKAFATIGLALVLLGGSILFVARDTEYIKSNTALSRFASVFTTSFCGDASQSRCQIWKIAGKGIAEKPLGWGFENYSYSFYNYYTPELVRYEAWFDRAHNIFIDWMIYGGIPGGLLFISLFVFSGIYIWRKNATLGKEPIPLEIKLVITGSLLAYAAQGFFLFDNFFSYLWLYTTFAFVYAVASDGHRNDHEQVSYLKTRNGRIVTGITAGVIGLVFAIYTISINADTIAVNKKIVTTLRLRSEAVSIIQSKLDPKVQISLLNEYFGAVANATKDESVTESPYRFEFRQQLFQSVPDLLVFKQIPTIAPYVAQILENTNTQAEKQVQEAPHDVYMLYSVIVYYSSTNQSDKALAAAQKALAVNKDKQMIVILAIDAALQTGKKAEAREYLNHLLTISPEEYIMSRAAQYYVSAAEGDTSTLKTFFADQAFNRNIGLHRFVISNAMAYRQYAYLRAYIALYNEQGTKLGITNDLKDKVQQAQELINKQ